MSEIVNSIKYAMSLRTPQEEALSYLDAITSHCDYKKDNKETVEAAATEYCEKQRKIKAEFEFPSFCYAMATGISSFWLLVILFMISSAKRPIRIIRSISSRDSKQRWGGPRCMTGKTMIPIQ